MDSRDDLTALIFLSKVHNLTDITKWSYQCGNGVEINLPLLFLE